MVGRQGVYVPDKGGERRLESGEDNRAYHKISRQTHRNLYERQLSTLVGVEGLTAGRIDKLSQNETFQLS